MSDKNSLSIFSFFCIIYTAPKSVPITVVIYPKVWWYKVLCHTNPVEEFGQSTVGKPGSVHNAWTSEGRLKAGDGIMPTLLKSSLMAAINWDFGFSPQGPLHVTSFCFLTVWQPSSKDKLLEKGNTQKLYLFHGLGHIVSPLPHLLIRGIKVFFA